MDKTKLARLIQTAKLDAVTIASTASKAERDIQIREFSRKIERAQTGEIILVIIQN